MSGDTGRARVLRGLMLVARRELIVRVRSTAFRVSTIILLAVTVAGIAITAALTGHPQRFTVAVTAQAPPAVAAAVRADGNAAGLQVTVVTAAGRAAAVRSVEQGRVTAAVAAGGEIIWKAQPSSTLHPVLNAAVQQAIITQRAASLGLSADATARLLAPVRVTVTQLHSQSQRTARMIIADVGIVLMFMAISVYGGYVLTGVVEEKSSRVVEVLLSRVPPSSLLGGKIAGIGLAGLAQFVAVAAAAAHAPGHPALRRAAGNLHGDSGAGAVVRARFRVLQHALWQPRQPGIPDRGCAGRCGPGHRPAYRHLCSRVRGDGQPRRAMGHHRVHAAAVGAHVHAAAHRPRERSSLADSDRGDPHARRDLRPVPRRRRLYQNAVLHTGARLRLREAWHGEPPRPQPARR